MKKKILIFSASIGTGHTQAARAIEEYIQQTSDEYEIEHIDFLSNDALSIDNIVKETYIKILDFFPMLYDLMYYSSQGYKKGRFIKTLIARGLKRRMLSVLTNRKPDILIFTHPFPAGAAALLKRQHRISMPLMGVITDFAIHQLWVYPQLDQYCVATDSLKQLLQQQGIQADKIAVTGIPVRSVFRNQVWQWGQETNHKNHILIMGGGLGMGSIRQSLVALDQVPLIDSFSVVTGHNTDLYDEICELRSTLQHPVEVLGYTQEIPSLMARSALLVTKPGALTCTEATTIQIPLVLYSPIPGQEEANATYMCKTGCAHWVKNEKELSNMVTTLLANPAELEKMSKASSLCQTDGMQIMEGKIKLLLQE